MHESRVTLVGFVYDPIRAAGTGIPVKSEFTTLSKTSTGYYSIYKEDNEVFMFRT